MRYYKTALAGIAIASLLLAACGGDIAVPPPETDTDKAEQRKRAFVEAMKPRRPGKPLVAIAMLNEGTEITDFLLPHAVLERSELVDLQPVAPRAGRVTLYPPPLQVEGAQDFASFDAAHPQGADYVIVPAMSRDDEPAIHAWLKRQHERGARIIGVCVGALVVGAAGLLDGRNFVTHWYYRPRAIEHARNGTYVPHQRYVVDRDVATTTGITASVPTMLALLESIGGSERARAVATELGVDRWTPEHDSSRFGLNAARRFDYVWNKLAFWRHEDWAVELRDGMDDVALAFAADAWGRTQLVTVTPSGDGRVTLRSGVVIAAGPVSKDAPRLPLTAALKPAQQLDRTLCEIERRFGASRRAWVAMELEYAGGDACAR